MLCENSTQCEDEIPQWYKRMCYVKTVYNVYVLVCKYFPSQFIVLKGLMKQQDSDEAIHQDLKRGYMTSRYMTSRYMTSRYMTSRYWLQDTWLQDTWFQDTWLQDTWLQDV